MTETPIHIVKISGIVSQTALKLVSKGLTRSRDKKVSIDMFCEYSEYEIPIGTEFNYLKDIKHNTFLKLKAVLIDVTQSWGLSFDTIPKGHKTISRFEFTEIDLNIITDKIPIIDTWSFAEWELLKI